LTSWIVALVDLMYFSTALLHWLSMTFSFGLNPCSVRYS
jgi:hypothetical protein